ncbi:MAG TPA: hypothetical protein VMV87_16260 [Burkholderiales bacterium]|nr:hypothetical protein [Burkholderiales bacterium]
MPAEEPAAAAAWQVHARAAFASAKGALLAAARIALDKGIASLQGLRKRAGAAAEQDAPREHEHPGKRATAGRLMDEAAAAAAIAPKPRRRLRRLLLYLCVILAGAMLGTALAYKLLAQLLERQALEIQRQELRLSGYSKSVSELKGKLARQQAQRAEVDARLAKSLAENAKTLVQMRARQTSALAGRARTPPPADGADRGGGIARKARGGWTGSGSCTVGSGDVRSVLAGCIAEMNRR